MTTEAKIDCPACEGVGSFEEAEYIMMKLEGLV